MYTKEQQYRQRRDDPLLHQNLIACVTTFTMPLYGAYFVSFTHTHSLCCVEAGAEWSVRWLPTGGERAGAGDEALEDQIELGGGEFCCRISLSSHLLHLCSDFPKVWGVLIIGGWSWGGGVCAHVH